MKQSEHTHKILLAYISSHSSEIFKRKIELRYPEIDTLQIQVLTDHLQKFCDSRKNDEILLLFPYILNNIRFTNPELKISGMVKTLWERGFNDSVESKEQLEQMYKIWLSFEKEMLNLEMLKDKTQEKGIEPK
ncbi:hypothetical protein HIO71_12265 [Chryseobacterium aquaticum]|uniref:Uncharacterized protein n=1 Tax=Chryseobacterium aquaticum TaxID=452084 RepID=A0A848N919_9FLAO|nr:MULTISPECIES: hypothetical protein [Chryseobacterium]NMR34961.1 hypothetical protein [Chryseobacterium aquaticum]NRQ47175.1 hypothetical protein [Chryseobacterium sp. C-204]